MKKSNKNFFYNVSLLLIVVLLAGCTGDGNEKSGMDSLENESTLESENEDFKETDVVESDDSNATIGSEESVTADSKNTPSEEIINDKSNNTYENEEEHPLSKYSSEEIEYARVWLQLGVIKEDVDELKVRHISAGTPLNPDDETSASFPKDVIQLAGSRLVDGSVTYNGNGDGTINVYNVPLRWDGEYPAGEEFYNDIIENTESVYVDPNDDEKIITIIEKMKIH